MKHLQRVPLPNSDMFISDINTDLMEIQYEVREKDTGKLMEAMQVVKMSMSEDNNKVHFDNRTIPTKMFNHLITQRIG